MIVINDFLRAQRSMNVLKSWDSGTAFSENRIIADALFESIVMSYTRCFIKSKTNTEDIALHEAVAGRFTVFRKAIEESLDSPLSKQHQRLKDIRRNYFSHSSADAFKQSHSKNYAVTIAHNPFYPLEEPDLSWTAELVDFWVEEIEAELLAKKTLLIPTEPIAV